MVASELIAASVFILIGGVILLNARGPYNRYTSLTDLTTDSRGIEDEGTEATVHGPVRVTESATPERSPPDSVVSDDGSPTLWAWRIRRKVRTGSGNQSQTRWRTVDAGLAVGEFAVRQDWEHVRVNTDCLTNEQDATPEGMADPFDSPYLYLGAPDTDVPLGKLGPLNTFLEKWGLTGENGVLSEWEFTISVGRSTLTPDRYQATVIREGDELLVRGKQDEIDEGPILRGADDTPLLIAAGDLEAQADQFRSKAVKQGFIGSALVVLGGFVAIAGTVEFGL